MVVDDSEDIRELLRMQLTQFGYRVVEVADGREAVEAVMKECPDLILMDLTMPVLDVFEATRLIRRIEAACGVVIGDSGRAFGEGVRQIGDRPGQERRHGTRPRHCQAVRRSARRPGLR